MNIGKAISIIHGYEGLGGWNPDKHLFFPYQGTADKKEVWTVGRGHVVKLGETQKFKNGLTLAQVDALFAQDMAPRIVRCAEVMKGANDNQINGVLAMFFNYEKAWTPGHTPYDCYKAKDFKGMAEGMLLYIKSGKPLKARRGLWRRRMTEALCTLTGDVIIAKDEDTEQKLFNKLKLEIPVNLPHFPK